MKIKRGFFKKESISILINHTKVKLLVKVYNVQDSLHIVTTLDQANKKKIKKTVKQ